MKRLIKKEADSDGNDFLVSPVSKIYYNNNYFTDFRQQQKHDNKKQPNKNKDKNFKDILKEQMDMFNLLNG